MDKNYKFVFKFGSQINNELNGSDIIFCEFLEKDKLNESKFSVKEYLKQRKTLNFMIQRINKTQAVQDFNKLYLISNLSGVNLPRLSNLQREIVETVDKNILVQGVAGSGKTNICIDKIIFTACKNFSGKVLYTTFSRGLLIDTKLKVEAYKKDLQPALRLVTEDELTIFKDASEYEKDLLALQTLKIIDVNVINNEEINSIYNIMLTEYNSEEIPSSKIIEWFKEGLEIHKKENSKKCKFCGGNCRPNYSSPDLCGFPKTKF